MFENWLLRDLFANFVWLLILGAGALVYRWAHRWWRNQSAERKKAFDKRVVSISSSPDSFKQLQIQINHAITLTFMAVFTIMIMLTLAQIAEQLDFLSTAVSAYVLALFVILIAGRIYIKVTGDYEVYKEIRRRMKAELERMSEPPGD